MPGSEAYRTALALLSRRDHFRRDLANRLRQKGHDPDEVEAAVERCVDLGLVDDHALAERFVAACSVGRGWGPGRLAAELRRRGADQDLAEEASRLDPELEAEALAVALRRADVRARQGWWRLHDRRLRMVSSLVSRGFDPDQVFAAVSRLAAEREDEQHALDDEPSDPLRIP